MVNMRVAYLSIASPRGLRQAVMTITNLAEQIESANSDKFTNHIIYPVV